MCNGLQFCCNGTPRRALSSHNPASKLSETIEQRRFSGAALSVQFTNAVFAVALDFDVFDLVGLGTIASAIFLRTSDLTTARRVRALVFAIEINRF